MRSYPLVGNLELQQQDQKEKKECDPRPGAIRALFRERRPEQADVLSLLEVPGHRLVQRQESVTEKRKTF